MPLHEDKGYGFDADEVLSLINSNTRLLIINLPSNPTGGTVPRTEIEKLVHGLAEHPHVCVLSDEIYSRILYDGREHVSFLEYEQLRDRLILLDGWSKTYAMTGWRLGYGVWPESLIEIATRLSINCHSCVNAATQYAGIAALEGPQDAVDEMTDAFDERRQVIVNELNQIPGFNCPEPGGAFYTFPNISGTGYKSLDLQEVCLNKGGVALISGTSFGHLGEGYIRFSYANSTENIIEAIRRIKTCL
jgi:aspartate/methionine/tyrosine aminotransferase